jgi:hypothetical protein
VRQNKSVGPRLCVAVNLRDVYRKEITTIVGAAETCRRIRLLLRKIAARSSKFVRILPCCSGKDHIREVKVDDVPVPGQIWKDMPSEMLHIFDIDPTQVPKLAWEMGILGGPLFVLLLGVVALTKYSESIKKLIFFQAAIVIAESSQSDCYVRVTELGAR